MYYLLLIIAFLVAATSLSCGPNHSRVRGTGPRLEELRERQERYLSLQESLERDSHGWFYGEDCDGLLFESLLSVSSGREVDIQAAEMEPGRFYRNPQREGCSNDTSRDMHLGLFWYIWHWRRLDIAEQVWAYGESHGWKMGIVGDTRLILSPGLIGLLGRIIHELGGADHAQRYYREKFYSTELGYQSHLTTLHILLDGEVSGNITDRQLSMLREIAEMNPTNPLSQASYHKYTDGEMSGATDLLLNLFPVDRLPDGRDWRHGWFLEKDLRKESEWGSGDPREQHSGGDFLFTARVILQ
jgi:hypothetical protein